MRCPALRLQLLLLHICLRLIGASADSTTFVCLSLHMLGLLPDLNAASLMDLNMRNRPVTNTLPKG